MTDKLREAAQQALEALDNMTDSQSNPARRNFPTIHDYGKSRRAADALRAALAQQDAQAVPPKVWPDVMLPKPELLVWRGGKLHGAGFSAKQVRKCAKDYALSMLNAAPTPPARATLTASEILNMTPESIPAEHDGALLEYARDIIEAYERKNGIK